MACSQLAMRQPTGVAAAARRCGASSTKLIIIRTPQRPALLHAPQQKLVQTRCQSPGSASVVAEARPTLTGGQVHAVNAAELQELISDAEPLVVVSISTTWCGPCKVIAPELDKMAAELGEQVVMVKMDCTSINDNKKWAMAQNVKALPTFILFKHGQRVGDMTGAKAPSLRKLIEVHM